ncbi:15038_t:CDS:2 [Gigaspora rosea]|nr:15038_t:CDS:2 [Gigaspora rosea]
MSFHVHRILEIEPLEHNEEIIDLTSSDTNNLQHSNQNNDDLPHSKISPWVISEKMQEQIDKFENTILCQFSCVPCSICSRLMYPEKSMWIQRNPDIPYPLENYMPLVTNPVPPASRIAVCSLCKSNPTRNYPPYLSPVPTEIEQVPLVLRKHLSLIFLHCSLGRTPGANPFSEYRTLVGTMNYSQNFNSLNLYSGLLGADLALSSSTQSMLPPWFDNSLINATNWLKENNPYIRERIINSSVQVQYLTTDPLSVRSKAIIPLYMLDSLEDGPYWNDKIEKYFARPYYWPKMTITAGDK